MRKLRGLFYNSLGLLGSSTVSIVSIWEGISDIVGVVSGLAAASLTFGLAFIRYEQARALRIKNKIALYELEKRTKNDANGQQSAG
jgi:hypothetical protein